MKPIIISEEPISMTELREEMEKLKKREGEPNIRVGKVEEYLNSFVTLSGKEGQELFDKLMKLNIPRLKELHVKKMLDLTPGSVNDVKMLLQNYTVTISNENAKKIVDILKPKQ